MAEIELKSCTREQIDAVTSSIRGRIMAQARQGTFTAAALAERMEVSQTRLYRHLDALTDAGLLRVVGEKRKRGTIERTYEAATDMAGVLCQDDAGIKMRLEWRIEAEDEPDFFRAIADLAAEYASSDGGAAILSVQLDRV